MVFLEVFDRQKPLQIADLINYRLTTVYFKI